MRRRPRPALGLFVATLMATLAPPTALGGEPGAPVNDVGSATLIVILLLASITAGLFFASPLRRRLDRSDESAATQPARDARAAPRGLRPVGQIVGRGRRLVDGLLDAGGERVHAAGRRLGKPRPSPPLPPMPGGDAFFDEPD